MEDLQKFPHEIISKIIHTLPILSSYRSTTEMYRNILTCGLVCSAWVFTSREVYFSIIQIDIHNTQLASHYTQLLQSPYSTFRQHRVRKIIISDINEMPIWADLFGVLSSTSVHPQELGLIFADNPSVHVSYLLYSMPKISLWMHTLYVWRPFMSSSAAIEMLYELVQAIAACPRLEKMSFNMNYSGDEPLGTLPLSHIPPNTLKHLELNVPGVMLYSLLPWFQRDPQIWALETLTLELHTDDAAATAAVNQCLQDLSWRLTAVTFNLSLSIDNKTSSHLDLPLLTHLRRIVLVSWLLSDTEDIDRICARLETLCNPSTSTHINTTLVLVLLLQFDSGLDEDEVDEAEVLPGETLYPNPEAYAALDNLIANKLPGNLNAELVIQLYWESMEMQRPDVEAAFPSCIEVLGMEKRFRIEDRGP